MQTRFRHQNKSSYRYRNEINTVNQLQPNYFIYQHTFIDSAIYEYLLCYNYKTKYTYVKIMKIYAQKVTLFFFFFSVRFLSVCPWKPYIKIIKCFVFIIKGLLVHFSLYSQLCKKHTKLVDQIRISAMKAGTKAVATETKTADDMDESTQEDYVILLKTK